MNQRLLLQHPPPLFSFLSSFGDLFLLSVQHIYLALFSTSEVLHKMSKIPFFLNCVPGHSSSKHFSIVVLPPFLTHALTDSSSSVVFGFAFEGLHNLVPTQHDFSHSILRFDSYLQVLYDPCHHDTRFFRLTLACPRAAFHFWGEIAANSLISICSFIKILLCHGGYQKCMAANRMCCFYS